MTLTHLISEQVQVVSNDGIRTMTTAMIIIIYQLSYEATQLEADQYLLPSCVPVKRTG